MKVQPEERMTDEQFRQHLEHRHLPVGDFANLTGFHPGQNFAVNRSTHAAYHRRLHREYDYDHQHS